jgi:phage terminase large subunit
MRILPTNATNVYLPDIIGKGYGAYWKDEKRYRVLKGGKGSKKSTTTALNFIYRIMKCCESNLLVVRAVFNTHKDSTFAQLKWAQEKLGVSHLWHNTLSPLEMTYLPTGQKILFRGFDDVLKLASTTVAKGYLCWVWIEEAFEIESEADFDKLDLSVPRGNVPEHLFKQTTLTFNPWSETHWLKKRFFDTPKDNVSTYSTNYLCNEFLDDTDRLVFERMRAENHRKYAVAGLGEWGIAEGLVYENWQTLEFDYKELGIERDENSQITIDNSWKYRSFFGLDYGYTNDPTAFIAFAVNKVDKEIFIYDEHYEVKMLNSDIAAMIKRKGYNKERIRADAAEPKSNEDLRRLGISRILPSVKGKDSIINGIAQIQEYKIYVHPRCENAIKELSSYCWQKDKSENGINKPADTNNHLMDAFRYGFYDVLFYHPQKEKPRVRVDKSNITAADVNGSWI